MRDKKTIYWFAPDVKFKDQLPYASGMRVQTELCRADPKHTLRSRWPRPLKVIGNSRSTTDVEWTVYSDCIVSKEVAQVIKGSGFSGIKLNSIEFFSTTTTPFGRESLELRVNGWGGMASSKSGIHILKKCSYCDRCVYSAYKNKDKLFDLDKWDGSDFFLIWPLPRFIFVTEKAASFITNAGYTGVSIRELNELPDIIAGTFTPGHIEDWYDAEKAVKINEALK